MKTVLITGIAGFIGSNLAITLLEKYPNINIIGIDNFSHGNFNNIPISSNVIVFPYSILDREQLKNLYDCRFDAIFHLAAITDTTNHNIAQQLECNVIGFKNIIELAEKTKTRTIVYASSASVYGDTFTQYQFGHISPINEYAFSKWQMELLARKCFSEKIKLIGMRYFNVYGNGELHKNQSASMVTRLICQIKKYGKCFLFKEGEQTRDFIYVKDAVELTIKATETPTPYKVWDCGTGHDISFNEVVRIIGNEFNLHPQIEYIHNPHQQYYQNITRADMGLWKQYFKFMPQFSLKEGIHDYIHNYIDYVPF